MFTCCNKSTFQKIQLLANMRKYHIKLFNPFKSVSFVTLCLRHSRASASFKAGEAEEADALINCLVNNILRSIFCFVGHGEAWVNSDKANPPPRRIWKRTFVNVWPADEIFWKHIVHSVSCSSRRKDERQKERKWKIRVYVRILIPLKRREWKLICRYVFQLCLCFYSYQRNETPFLPFFCQFVDRSELFSVPSL